MPHKIVEQVAGRRRRGVVSTMLASDRSLPCIDPAILYFGTPVVLISTENEDGAPNQAPMRSARWIGHRCVFGLAKAPKTAQNILRMGQCVLNMPSIDQVDVVDRLARTTGSDPVPEGKVARGYRFVRDKFADAELTPIPSELD